MKNLMVVLILTMGATQVMADDDLRVSPNSSIKLCSTYNLILSGYKKALARKEICPGLTNTEQCLAQTNNAIKSYEQQILVSSGTEGGTVSQTNLVLDNKKLEIKIGELTVRRAWVNYIRNMTQVRFTLAGICPYLEDKVDLNNLEALKQAFQKALADMK